MADAAEPTVRSVLTTAVKDAHWVINSTFEDVTDEFANRKPSGIANPLGTAYAHLALSEDAIVNGLLKRQAPLFASTFQGRTGVDREMPMPGFAEGDLGDWFRNATVDLESLRAYAGEVFTATEEFIAGTDDETLRREIDLSAMGLEIKLFTDVVTLFIVGHCHDLTGEIAAIKGTFGLKGYPF